MRRCYIKSWPDTWCRSPPGPIREIEGFETHICVTREMRAVFMTHICDTRQRWVNTVSLHSPELTVRNSTRASMPPCCATAVWFSEFPRHSTRTAFTAFTNTSSSSDSSRCTKGIMMPWSARADWLSSTQARSDNTIEALDWISSAGLLSRMIRVGPALAWVRARRMGSCSEMLQRTEAETDCKSSLSVRRRSTSAGTPPVKTKTAISVNQSSDWVYGKWSKEYSM